MLWTKRGFNQNRDDDDVDKPTKFFYYFVHLLHIYKLFRGNSFTERQEEESFESSECQIICEYSL